MKKTMIKYIACALAGAAVAFGPIHVKGYSDGEKDVVGNICIYSDTNANGLYDTFTIGFNSGQLGLMHQGQDFVGVSEYSAEQLRNLHESKQFPKGVEKILFE
jgi:hypothetical protein